MTGCSITSMVFGTRLALVATGVALLSVACTSSESDTTDSTISDTPLTTLVTSQGTEAADTSTTTTTEPPKTILAAPDYRIVDRIEGEGTGDTVIVLLDSDTYDSLTDLDLYDLIAEVVELFPPIAVVHIVDDAAAANVIANAEASEAERNAVKANYLARLDDGVQITYLGPFASSGTAVLGS
jgi:hypothetical protein